MALQGFTSTTGTEFGEVDNPAYGGYTEPGWNKGAFGHPLTGWDNPGFALPPSVLKPYGYGSKDFGAKFNQDYEIQAYSPDTGKIVTGPLKDLGPGPGTKAGIDMLGGSRSALGLERNFSGPIQYRIVPKGTPTPEGASLASVNTSGSPTPIAAQLGALVAPEAASTAAAGAGDTVLTDRIKELQAAMGLSGGAPSAAVGSAAASPQAEAGAGDGGFGLSPSSIGTVAGNFALIDAIRRNRAAQALSLQNAVKFGGQLGSAAGKAYGQFTNLNPAFNQSWADQQAQAAGYPDYAAMQRAGAV
jgi:hypothetical protein